MSGVTGDFGCAIVIHSPQPQKKNKLSCAPWILIYLSVPHHKNINTIFFHRIAKPLSTTALRIQITMLRFHDSDIFKRFMNIQPEVNQNF